MSYLAVTLRAFVPVATSFGWAWGAWAGDDPLASEHIRTVGELPRTIRTYAMMVGALLREKDGGDRFNVTAFGTVSGRTYGRDQWLWDVHCGVYRPHGEPWVPYMEEAHQGTPQRATVTRLATRQYPLPDAPRAA